MILGETDILIHIESDDVLETDQPLLEIFDQDAVDADRRGAGGQAQNKGTLGGGTKLVHSGDDVLGWQG